VPEGDTVHRIARALRPVLEAEPLRSVWLRDRGPVDGLAGWSAVEVSPLGKHLLVGLARRPGERPAWVLHVHLGMHGRWRRVRPGTPGPRTPSVRLDLGESTLVCSRAARAELLPAAAVVWHPTLSRLGPDLLARRVPWERVGARARAGEPRAVAELLLDQRVACGIGNVYKSEVLFLEGVHPRIPARALSDARLLALFRRARSLLARNLGDGPRTTRRRVTARTPLRPGEPRYWVYDRAGRPCGRCGAPVRGARVGDAARATFWCPACQPERAAAAGLPAPAATGG
jgi:endonuclease-8